MESFDFRSVFLPYCLRRQDDWRFVVLNRAYTPVGFFTSDSVVYSDYPVLVSLNGLTGRKAAMLSDTGESNVDEIYLYSDKTNPGNSTANMEAYLKKIAILARLAVE